VATPQADKEEKEKTADSLRVSSPQQPVSPVHISADAQLTQPASRQRGQRLRYGSPHIILNLWVKKTKSNHSEV